MHHADSTENLVLSSLTSSAVLVLSVLSYFFQERSVLLRKWFDLLTKHKEDLAKIITAECVSKFRFHVSNFSLYLHGVGLDVLSDWPQSYVYIMCR